MEDGEWRMENGLFPSSILYPPSSLKDGGLAVPILFSDWQFVRRAVLVAQILVRLLVVREPLRFRIPFEVRLCSVRDVADQRRGSFAVADLDVAVALLPAAHAIEEVTGVKGSVARSRDFPRFDLCFRPSAIATF